MAKVKAPLFSFGASGAIGDSLVFFPWKGLDVARSYTVPANPRSTAQVTQRGYVTTVVGLIHAAQAQAVDPIAAADVAGYALEASTESSPRTWFNQVVKQGVNQLKAGKNVAIFSAGGTTPGANELAVTIRATSNGANSVTAGTFYYGTSKTALINTAAAAVVGEVATATIAGLATGTKYFWQFRPTAHADFVGTKSGIYYGVPT